VLDLLKPSQSRQHNKDEIKIKQKQQYNRTHGVKAKQFAEDTSVYVKMYSNNKWTKEESSNALVKYNVLLDTQDRLVRAHANQLRLRVLEAAPETQDQQLPSDILLETFNIPHTDN